MREKKSRPTAGHRRDLLWGGLVLYGGASLEEAQILGDGRGEEAVLQLVDACGERVDGVIRAHGAGRLQEVAPVVIIFVDEVDGDTTLLRSRGDDGSVHSVAVHALTAERGEERWVDVDDALGILHYIYRSDEAEIARQDDELDAVLLHQSYRARAFTKLCVCKIMTRYTQSFSPLDDPCLRLVCDDHSHLRLACSAEMMDDSFGV